MYVNIKPKYTKENKYFSFSEYTKEKYSARVGKISIDTRFGCMHKNNKGGCVFCNLEGYRPENTKIYYSEKQWEKGSETKRYEKFYAYFQLGTPLSSESEKYTISEIYNLINKENCVGIMFGARSDMTSEKTLCMLNDIAEKTKKEIWLEIGLQSVNDKTLTYINRGHDYKNFEDIIYKIDEQYKNIYVCVHVIIGLPKNENEIENEDEIIHTVKTLSSLPVASVKYHNLQIVKNTMLKKINENKKIKTLSEDEYIDIMTKVIGYTNKRFVISRLVGDTKKDYLVSPKWELNKSQLLNKMHNLMIERNIEQGIML